MPLIEGVGDEVVQFVGVVFVLVVGALAWCSTNARPDRYRTVLIMRSRPHHPVTVSIRTRPSLMASSTQASSSTQSSTADTAMAASTSEAGEEPRVSSRVIPLQEMDSIVDADMAMLDNNRLHFYRRVHHSPNMTQTVAESASEEGEAQEETEAASTAQIREMDSIVSAMEADVTSSCDCYSPDTNSPSATPETKAQKEENVTEEAATAAAQSSDTDASQGTSGAADARKILIKLKYLNDTLKEVEGSLDEPLKDFKWRHFSSELSAECRVRLIFQGRALLDERATLRACGLHHRAVVHCLVHPKRGRGERAQGTGNGAGAGPAGGEAHLGTTHELVSEGAAPERAWDLENILMTLVSVALTVVWFFRCEYSNMFTASASVALFGLTVFYSVAIFGLYLSDSFHLERRNNNQQPAPAPPPQPVPNN